jgi:anti-sigma B factor antagonist
MALQMITHSFAGTRIVECSGRIVLGDESANLSQVVKEVLSECKHIVLDVGGVTCIDCIGLGVLVEVLLSAQKAGGDVRLANLRPHLINVMGVTKLMTLFQTFGRAEDAARSFDSITSQGKAA